MNALQLLQFKSGITPDGIFGPNTFKHCSAYLGITDKNQAVHFWAQCAHESANFIRFEENLNYSAEGLVKTFGKYFESLDHAREYDRIPEKIANRVYANRMGNGDEDSGEGYLYRGRGAIQLTGKNNYLKFLNDELGVSAYSLSPFHANLIATKHAFDVAIWFFNKNNLWKYCVDTSESSVKKLTKRINGGYNGLAHRVSLTNKYNKYDL